MPKPPLNPDLDWVANYLGAPLPDEFRELHDSGKAASLDDLIVDKSDDQGEGLYFCIAHWTQQNPREYDGDKHNKQPRLLLTRDYSGNICFALANEHFKMVYQLDHATGTSTSLGIDVPTFIRLAREEKLREEEDE